MVDVVVATGRVLLALFLVGLNGFFVASEFALVRIRGTTVEQLANANRAGSAALEDALDNLDDFLAATQLGITIASLGLGWVGEPAVAALIEPVLEPLVSERLVHIIAFAIGFSIITFLHVVFGELAPKTIAIQRAESLALLVAPPMKLFYYLFMPGIVVFNGAANFSTRILGIDPASEIDETLGEEEIRMVLSQASRAGHVDRAEVDMVEGVFELDDTPVRQVMVPRPDVVSVQPETTLSDLQALVEETGHTRYPVVDTDDEVLGFVDTKDILGATTGDTDGQEPTARDLSRDIVVVPEMVAVDELLARLQDEQRQMAAVIDEWGALEGMVTVEDVTEEIVGEFHDEFDAPSAVPSIESRQDGSYRIDGGVPVATLAEELGSVTERESADTVAGLVLDELGRAPEVGDTVELGEYTVEITAVEGSRIETVVATKTAKE